LAQSLHSAFNRWCLQSCKHNCVPYLPIERRTEPHGERKRKDTRCALNRIPAM
jgi:hypothetical protein